MKQPAPSKNIRFQARRAWVELRAFEGRLTDTLAVRSTSRKEITIQKLGRIVKFAVCPNDAVEDTTVKFATAKVVVAQCNVEN